MKYPGEVATATRLYESYHAFTMRKMALIAILSVAVTVATVISICVGSVGIDVGDVVKAIGHTLFPWVDGPEKGWYGSIIMGIRLPRALMCMLCGFVLAVSGAVMQNLLKNPLVSPFTLGVSSAASFGASLAIVSGPLLLGSAYVSEISILGQGLSMEVVVLVASSFVFGMMSILLILAISRRNDISRSTIILSGVILSYLFQAGISAAKYVSSDDALREITMWLMGGMWGSSWGAVAAVLPVAAIGMAYLMTQTPKINMLSAGDEVAESMGVNIGRLRTCSLVVCTAMVSSCIAFTGIIGFVGLIAPHIVRMAIGNDSRYLVPAAGLFGALLLLVSDTFARVVISPEELPVGIIMYVLGGAFFIWIVLFRKRSVEL